MFDTLLIANRGEIASRIIRTARRMGLRTVAVFSQADADARHVRLADEAVCIGPPPARESYLSVPRILDAARRTGAQAVHPGYGFLSENEGFAQACADADLVFVGPPVAAIRAMGSKSEAKKLMETAGVPLTPGYHGDDQDGARLRAEADRIGYPVLIKAAAGGGGKGMRRVERAEDFAAELAACQREAQASFGDAHVLVERYVTRPRHVEIQVFSDSHGRHVSLFERDCSVQRRHQKVLEEAPAPGLAPALRDQMGAAAVEAARAVGYVGAGTVEFILAPDGSFYFMEMNTRLQVEHPVTEMITGLDLVEWQLRVAAGEPLPEVDLRIDGHAIEARLYAEDPDRGFLPSTGTLAHLSFPPEGPHVRVDTGVGQGDAITPFYDPMIAKLIVWDRTRPAALARLRQALRQVRIAGVANNVAFLSRLVDTPSFSAPHLDTGLIEREAGRLFPPPRSVPDAAWFAAALAQVLREGGDGWRLNGTLTRTLALRAGDGPVREVAVSYLPGAFRLSLDGHEATARATLEGERLELELDGHRQRVWVTPVGSGLQVAMGQTWTLTPVDPLASVEGAADAGAGLVAPMPGRVIALLVAPGTWVAAGTALLVLEAMKMEHRLTAPADGTLTAFRCGVDDQVAEGTLLADFDPDPRPG
jgi:3-methylcrotonyl-CoA carboxylase alpha subunit